MTVDHSGWPDAAVPRTGSSVVSASRTCGASGDGERGGVGGVTLRHCCGGGGGGVGGSCGS